MTIYTWDYLSQAELEEFNERAMVFEFDAGMTRDDAERECSLDACHNGESDDA